MDSDIIGWRLSHLKSESDWLSFAMKHYSNPHITCVDEFNEDLKRFSYLQSLFNKYHHKNDLNERLIINHIIVLSNMFGCQAVVDLLYYKINQEYWKVLTTFLLFLNILDCEYPTDENVSKVLESL